MFLSQNCYLLINHGILRVFLKGCFIFTKIKVNLYKELKL